MWGQVYKSCFVNTVIRIIPTRVGTRSTVPPLICFGKDHPHACGDKSVNDALTIRQLGSSPRVWGQVCRNQTQRPQLQDHPHACGDKYPKHENDNALRGSSPRVWGQVRQMQNLRIRSRIIPTRVGTSERALAKLFLNKDHPHACGDKYSV